MALFQSNVSVSAKEFSENKEALKKNWQEYKSLLELKEAHWGKAKEKTYQRKKLLVKERIAHLIDSNSTFLEFSPMAAYDLYNNDCIGAGIVTGIGAIKGRLAVIVANDPSVKGGTYYPLTAKKHLRAQEIALQNKLPCVYLVDSGGAFLPLQDEVFPDKDHFGRIFYNQAQLSAQGIPQLACVLGSCTAGGAYVPAMADEVIIVQENGTIFLGGPPLVKAATGEEVTAQELGGGLVHAKISGVADYLALNELAALEQVRTCFDSIPAFLDPSFLQKTPFYKHVFKNTPYYSAEEIWGLYPSNPKKSFDMRELLVRILDSSDFNEFRPLYGETLLCAFGKIYGQEVGIIANNGVLFSESALKGAHFIQLCEQRLIPLVFIQNITGFMVGKKYEHEGIAKHGAKMVNAVSTSKVPKITLIVGGSFGAGNYGMCGRAYSPHFLWAWPSAKTAVMGPTQAANVLAQVKQEALISKGEGPLSVEEIDKFKQPIQERFERQCHFTYSTARLWDDGIINPIDTRVVLALSLASCSIFLESLKKKSPSSSGYGVFRM